MSKENLTLAYINADNPRDRRSWSGTHYRMLSALEKEFSKVEVIGPFRLHFLLSFFLKLKNIQHKILFGKKYDRAHCKLRSKYYAKIINKRIKTKTIDIIFAPAGSTEIAYLDTEIPICHLGDTSFNQIIEYYESFSGISKQSIKEANEIERKAIERSSVQVFSSNWAGDYAKSYYNAHNVKIVKFGANIDEAPPKKTIQKNYNEKINILFLGVNWERKGGDLALQAIEKLAEKFDNFTFTVCGCVPPNPNKRVEVIPFLNKNNEEDRIKFDQLLSQSHILFVPTRADCTPIVFCEASAFGLVILTTDTGGVSSVVLEGVNGYTLPLAAGPEEYANKLYKLVSDKEKLKALSVSSRMLYENQLNWETWGKEMRHILKDIQTPYHHK